MSNILEKILEDRVKTLKTTQIRVSSAAMQAIAKRAPIPFSFSEPFQNNGIHVIAELKKMSPSQGLIRKAFEIETLARQLVDQGAAAISVLTETPHFGGCLENLIRTHRTVKVPLLRKDFIFDPYQIYEARAYGASAVLLIAAALSQPRLVELTSIAHQFQLEVLGEVHNRHELNRMLDANVDLIGVNARNLKDFSTSLDLSAQLIQEVPAHKIPIAESAINTHTDVLALAQAGAKGFLIGTALMRAEDPGEKLRELIHG